MSFVRRITAPRRALLAIAGGFCVITAGLFGAVPALASAPHYSDTMPLNQIKPGMTGYGLTTFRGTTISRFKVTVIGIVRDSITVPGRNLILVKMLGGPITERGAFLIRGMSGSPIYINGKVVGAFSMGEEFPKEPIGMVTPIDDMLEAWDPDIPQQPSFFEPAGKTAPAPPPTSSPSKSRGTRRSSESGGLGAKDVTDSTWMPDARERTISLPNPIRVGNRSLTHLVINAAPNDRRVSDDHTAVMHRATDLMFAPGASAKSRQWLEKEFAKRGMSVTVLGGGGGGMDPNLHLPALQPGSCFGTFFVTGDITLGGYGTVTYRRGNRILAFGHPLMLLGTLDAAITSATVVDVFSGYETSHLIPMAGGIVGALRQDRNYSVAGEIGKLPKLIPFEVTVNDETSHRTKVFHTSVMQHPNLTAGLLTTVAQEAVSRVHFVPGDVMARISTTVDAAEVGSVTRSNVVYDPSHIEEAVTQDLDDITNIVSGNPFYPLPIRSGHMTINIVNGHDTATVERIFLKQGRFEPGDTLEIGVVLKPYRRDPVTRTISLKIPSETPSGRYPLIVRGGTPGMMTLASLLMGGGGGGASESRTPPVNVRQMVARLTQRETNTDIVARMVFNTVSPALDGDKLASLPPNLAALMRSDRNSGVRLERDETKAIQPVSYVVSGSQQLIVTVIRKNDQELNPTNLGQPTLGQPSSTGGGFPIGGNIGGVSISEEAANSDGDDQSIQPNHIVDQAMKPWLEAANSNAFLDLQSLGKGRVDLQAQPDTPKAKDTKPDATAPKPDGGKPAAPAPDTKQTGPTAEPPRPTGSTVESGSDKPVGRQTQYWRQTARLDFAAGKFDGTGVAASGDLRLTSSLRRIYGTNDTYIWSMAVDAQGTVYAGTGTSGRILKIDPLGHMTVLAQLPVSAVQCVLLAHDGSIWAGTGVRGEVYHVQKDGGYTLVTTLPEKYILALTETKDGAIFIGAGGGGNVYRLSPAAQISQSPKSAPPVFLKTSADHIMALGVDGQDNIYVGTGNSGIIYRVTPDGKNSIVYDARQNTITALAVAPDGTVYAGAGPKGILYRILPDGTSSILYDRATQFYTSIQLAPDGSLYASAVNTIYHVFPRGTNIDPVVVPLVNAKDVDYLSLVVLPSGGVEAGTGNIGEIYTSVPEDPHVKSLKGTFTSVVHDAKLASQWGTLRWESVQPTGTHVSAETRTGNISEPDATWSPWTQLRQTDNQEGLIVSPSGRFIQYRLTLEADLTARRVADVRSVSVSYLPRNQAPKVVFQTPSGGERWSKTQTARWSGSDPDNDTLSYDLFYSNDSGVTWKPVPTTAKEAAAPAVSAAPGSTETALPPGLDEVSKRLDQLPLSEVGKLEMLARFKSQMDKAAGLEDNSPAAAGTLRETNKNIDTTQLADGTYQLKVIASDRISNPIGALTAEAVSEPFVVVNSTPKIHIETPSILPGKLAGVRGSVNQALVPVTAVQYKVDGGEWTAATSATGLFDSENVQFLFLTSTLSSGKHTIVVEAFNGAGAKSTQSVDVTIP